MSKLVGQVRMVIIWIIIILVHHFIKLVVILGLNVEVRWSG